MLGIKHLTVAHSSVKSYEFVAALERLVIPLAIFECLYAVWLSLRGIHALLIFFTLILNLMSLPDRKFQPNLVLKYSAFLIFSGIPSSMVKKAAQIGFEHS